MLRRFQQVVGIAAVGAMTLGMPVSLALAEPPSPDVQAQSAEARYADEFTRRLAQRLNVNQRQLEREMRQAANATIQSALRNGDLTRNQAQHLRQEVRQGHFGAMFGMPEGRSGMRGGQQVRPQAMEREFINQEQVRAAVAQQLGLTPAQLKQELDQGATLEEIAQKQGVSAEQVRTAVMQAVQPQLLQATQTGKLSQQEANQWTEEIQQADFDELQSFIHEDSSDQGFQQPGAGMQPGTGAKPDAGTESEEEKSGPGERSGVDQFGPQAMERIEKHVDAQQVRAVVAQRLGLTDTQLEQQFSQGRTLEEIATERGVSEGQVRSAVVEAVQPQLQLAAQSGKISQQEATEWTQQFQQADLNAIQSFLQEEAMAQPGAGAQPGAQPGTGTQQGAGQFDPQAMQRAMQFVNEQQVRTAVAQQFGWSAAQLEQEFTLGKTLPQIAQEHGWPADQVRTAVLMSVQPQWQQAAQSGQISQQDYTQWSEQLQQADLSQLQSFLYEGAAAQPGQPAQPGAGSAPSAGMQPGTQPGAGSAPDTGVQPDAGSAPDTGVQPGAGSAPDTGVQPGAGSAPDTGVQPGAGSAPSTGVQPGAGTFDPQAMQQIKKHIEADAVRSAVAQQLGVTDTQLEQQFSQGRTLEEIATERGVPASQVRTTVISTVQPELQQAAQQGQITQQQAAQWTEQLQQADLNQLQGFMTKEAMTQPGADVQPGAGAGTGADQYSK